MGFCRESINDSQYQFIDVIKILLIAEVVLGHLGAMCLPDLNNNIYSIILIAKLFISYGREAAYIFIFLSGYLTANNFLSDDKTTFILRKRILRLFPAAIIGVLFTTIFDLLGGVVLNLKIYTNNPFGFVVLDHLSLILAIKNILFLQPTFSETFGSNGPVWTIGYLLQFYFISALLSLCFGKRLFFIVIPAFIAVSYKMNMEFSLLFLSWFVGLLTRVFKLRIDIKKRYMILIVVALVFFAKLSVQSLSIIITILASIFIIKISDNVFLGRKIKAVSIVSDKILVVYIIHMPLLFFIVGAWRVEKYNFSFNTIGALITFCVTLPILAYGVDKMLKFFMAR